MTRCCASMAQQTVEDWNQAMRETVAGLRMAA